ncbi:hypothetical protein ACOSQ2_031443 [Xanthoceras sorbifolium]
MLEAEKSKVEIKKLGEELESARKELAAGTQRENQLSKECESLWAAMEKSSVEHQSQIRELEEKIKQFNEGLTTKSSELAQVLASWEGEREKTFNNAQSDLLYSFWLEHPDLDYNFLSPTVSELLDNFRVIRAAETEADQQEKSGQ